MKPKLLKVKSKLSSAIAAITYGLETQHYMYPLKQFPDLNFYNKLPDHLAITNKAGSNNYSKTIHIATKRLRTGNFDCLLNPVAILSY